VRINLSTALCTSAAIAALFSPATAAAQQTETSGSASQSQSSRATIEDIVVTAQRREERAQDVPIVISAFSSQELQKMNISEAQDLYGSVPSLVVGNQGTTSRDAQVFSIRGQTTGFLALPSVATYFSEVPLVAAISLPLQGGHGNFVDLENVQVLSGPQGTLFGRNTTGGAVLLTPKRPTNDFEGYVQGSLGNYDLRNIEGAVNVPVIDDKLMIRLTGAYYDRRGFTKDLVWNKWRDDQNWYMGRVGIQLNPTETISNNLTVTASRSRNNSAGYVHRQFNPFGSAVGCSGTACDVYDRQTEIAQQIGPRRTRFGQDAYTNIDSFAAINTTDIELTDHLTLRNIVSYQNLKVDYGGDTDATPLQVYQLTQNSQFANFPIPGLTDEFGIPVGGFNNGGRTEHPRDHLKQFSEEIQLQGKLLDGNLDFAVGAFIIDAKPDGLWESRAVQFCPAIYTGNAQICRASRSLGGVTNKSRALYAQATLDFGAVSEALSDLRLTGGYRYTWDTVLGHSTTWTDTADGRFRCSTNGQTVSNLDDCGFSATLKTGAPTWTIGLDYKPFSGLMVYAKATRGYKAGGFNNIAVREEYQTFQPERLTSYEGGFKSNWRLAGAPGLLNVTYHYADYQNIQRPGSDFNPLTGVGGAAILAAAGTIQGVEAEASISPWQGFTIGGTLSHTDAEYTDYSFTSLGTDFTCLPGGGFARAGFGQKVDATCMPFQFVTPWMYNIHADAELPLANDLGTLNLYVSYSHFSGQPTAPAGDPSFEPGSILEAYGLLNASLDWRNVANSGVDLGLFVTNATNKLYRVSNTNIFNGIGVWSSLYGEPRMFGMKLRYSFGR
jgi:iron complex outermembrane receptor protein